MNLNASNHDYETFVELFRVYLLTKPYNCTFLCFVTDFHDFDEIIKIHYLLFLPTLPNTRKIYLGTDINVQGDSCEMVKCDV